jgi:hypothetical protein
MICWYKAVMLSLLFEGLPNPKEIATAQSAFELPLTTEQVVGLNLELSKEMAMKISCALAEIYVSNSIEALEYEGQEYEYHYEDHSLPFESIILQIECECGLISDIDSNSSSKKGSLIEVQCVECDKITEVKLGETLEE